MTSTKDNTLVICFDYPDKSMTRETVLFIHQHFDWANVRNACIDHIDVARNLAVKELIIPAPAKYEWVVLFDRDIRPSALSASFLALETDLASCRYETGKPASWALPDCFHLGLCKVRREVFHKMSAPWFHQELTPDRCAIANCQCTFFAANAVRLGFSISHSGWAEHDCKKSWGH